jgi:hypothetical protein
MNLEFTKSSIGCIDQVILRKIQQNKAEDKKCNRKITNDYVSIEDVKNLLIKQDNKCYVCHDIVITKEWHPNCLYQFTLDRIDNNLPHNKNNVLICCNYCNSYSHLPYKVSDMCCSKLCSSGCHTIKRNILRTRYDVPMKEIINLLLDCNIKLSDCNLKLSDNDKKLYHYDMVCNVIKNEEIFEKEYQFNREINYDDDNEEEELFEIDEDNEEEELFEINEDNEEEELFEIEIDDVTYFTSDENNGILYEITSDGDVGNKVGIIKDGEPFFK